MFLTGDPARARELASKLHELNQDRQQTEAEISRASLNSAWSSRSTLGRRAGLRCRRLASRRGRHCGQPRGRNASTGRFSYSELRMVWRKGRAAASPRFICWTRSKACRSCSVSSEAIARPPASLSPQPWSEEFRERLRGLCPHAPGSGGFRAGDPHRRGNRPGRDHQSGRGGYLEPGAFRFWQSRAFVCGPGVGTRRASRDSQGAARVPAASR